MTTDRIDSRIRLVVIDPMPLARKALAEAFRESSTIEMTAFSGVGPAERRLAESRPEVILLDLQPPVGRELGLLRVLRDQWPIPVVLFTALEDADRQEVVDSLSIPRSAVIDKPATNLARETLALLPILEAAVRRARADQPLVWRRRQAPVPSPRHLASAGRVIALGASTGGTEAIAAVLSRLPRAVPGLVVVQHMPAGFTRLFADRLDEICEIEVKEAEDGDEVRPGRALVAPGGRQMALVPVRQGFAVRIAEGGRVNGHCPSVDVLMLSVARLAGPLGAGILLTGMGNDGAAGMRAIRDVGGITIAQDKATSVVYGMPREAYLSGGAAKVLPLTDISQHLLALIAGQGN